MSSEWLADDEPATGHRSDRIHRLDRTHRGVLTARECLTLARPLLRAELSILAGRLAMVLRMHSGRRSSIDPASLVPPDSALARDAEVAAQDLLTPALRNRSSRAYTWGAAIAALQGITFDRELLYLAAMFHHTNPVPRPTSSLPAQPSMCSASAATRSPMQSARASSRSARDWALSGSSPGFSEPRPSKSLVAAPGTCTASP